MSTSAPNHRCSGHSGNSPSFSYQIIESGIETVHSIKAIEETGHPAVIASNNGCPGDLVSDHFVHNSPTCLEIE